MEGELFETTENLTEAFIEYSGFSKTTPKAVARSLKKARQEIVEGMRIVEIMEKHPSTGIKGPVKHRRRGLCNIKLKTISDIENEEDENKYNKKFKEDEIPF